VLHDDFEKSKIDGLALKRKRESIVILIELLAGSFNKNTKNKLESYCLKIYKNTIKSLK
jgi:hypothetical protein